MPQELIKEFIGKKCTIILFNESFGVQGIIVAIEDNWIKIEEKNTVRLINGDMIRDISLVPEKNKNKDLNNSLKLLIELKKYLVFF